ncbi:alanine racemase [Sphingomonas jejuensis]|uniref:alanine racemase n=1 Tax=Sphingomonas jejuensis TaxID=904715 RepID=UPI001438E636
MSAPLRLRLDGDALVHNWRWLKGMGGSAACGAAVKADGYGLGAREVVMRLAAAGCRDFFVATWAEAEALMPLGEALSLSVLHGVRAADMAVAVAHPARPVLNSREQVLRWREAAGARPCDVMVDTGMNRLGVSPDEVRDGLLDGLAIETLMSHLACGDEDHPMNPLQRDRLQALAGRTSARRMSLANSAGICLGRDYAFDLTRPGLALYGGVPRAEAAEHIRQVVFPEAEVLQVRTVKAGETVGYNATWRAERDTRVAILNIGYADGYARAFSNAGTAERGRFPLIGRVSMDLVAVDVSTGDCGESGWIEIDYNLPEVSAAGVSAYEALTRLDGRFTRYWR